MGVVKLPIDGKAVSMSYYSDSGAFLTDKGELYVIGPKLSFCMDESGIFEGLIPEKVNIENVKTAFSPGKSKK